MKKYVAFFVLLTGILPALAQELLSNADHEQSGFLVASHAMVKPSNTKKDAAPYYILLTDKNTLKQSTDFDLEFSPNPIQKGLFVKQPDFEVLKAMVYDSAERPVQTFIIDRGTQWLDLSGLYSGFYTIRFTDCRGEITQNFTLSKLNP